MLRSALIRFVQLARQSLQALKRRLRSIPAVRGLLDEAGEQAAFADSSVHEAMLADTVRMDAYHAAIRRNIKPGDVVVDLGTGTGILALLAAQQNPRVVHAIDSSNIVSLAERLVQANRVGNIRIHRVNSRRFRLEEPVDVIVHEQIGNALFDEGMVEKILDLKERLLKETGMILPGRFELFLEPACVRKDYRVPYLWENKIHGVDFASLKGSPEYGIHHLFHSSALGVSHSAIDYFLCDAAPVLAFDLNEIEDPAEIPTTIPVVRTVRRSGTLDGFCVYFRVIFDHEVSFDTSPFSPRTHWSNSLFRVEARQCLEGEILAYTLDMKEPVRVESWSVRMEDARRARDSVPL